MKAILVFLLLLSASVEAQVPSYVLYPRKHIGEVITFKITATSYSDSGCFDVYDKSWTEPDRKVVSHDCAFSGDVDEHWPAIVSLHEDDRKRLKRVPKVSPGDVVIVTGKLYDYSMGILMIEPRKIVLAP